MAVENYKKISEMTGSASISDNNLIPFVKPGDSNNYIITYRELADEILNDAGVDTQNRQDWTREISFTVSDTTSPGNVMLNMWSTANDQDSGLNFIEITKL